MATAKKKIAAKKPAIKKPTAKKPASKPAKKVTAPKATALKAQDLVKFNVHVLGASYVGIARVTGFTPNTLDLVDLETLPFPQKGRLITRITITKLEAKAAKLTKVTQADLNKAGITEALSAITSHPTMARLSTALS